MICTRRNLAEVPDSISVNTRYLNLQENSIKVNIEERAGNADASAACLLGVCYCGANEARLALTTLKTSRLERIEK